MAARILPLNLSCFTLGTSGVAGLVGGDEAVSALAIVHIFQNRRWLGWYNSPGSYQVAKWLSLFAKSRIVDIFLPGLCVDPIKLVESDIARGPKFRATQSGTVFEDTGYMGSLVMRKCASSSKREASPGRKTQPVKVTIVKLNQAPDERVELQVNQSNLKPNTLVFASIPIATSLSSFIICGISGDWYAFWLILLGILANGISSLVVGSGKLQFTHPHPAPGSPAGDGILILGKQIVLLQGTEGAVNSLTRGNFSLSFPNGVVQKYIELCSVLLTIQFILQLLLIPQASLLGQTLFVVTLTVSWIYNSFLASHMDEIQQDVLFNSVLKLKPSNLYLHTCGTYTFAVAFALLVLRPKEPMKFLDELLPDTRVWRQWKEMIIEQRFKEEAQIATADSGAAELTGDDSLLQTLQKDAEAAIEAYEMAYTQWVQEQDSRASGSISENPAEVS